MLLNHFENNLKDENVLDILCIYIHDIVHGLYSSDCRCTNSQDLPGADHPAEVKEIYDAEFDWLNK